MYVAKYISSFNVVAGRASGVYEAQGIQCVLVMLSTTYNLPCFRWWWVCRLTVASTVRLLMRVLVPSIRYIDSVCDMRRLVGVRDIRGSLLSVWTSVR